MVIIKGTCESSACSCGAKKLWPLVGSRTMVLVRLKEGHDAHKSVLYRPCVPCARYLHAPPSRVCFVGTERSHVDTFRHHHVHFTQYCYNRPGWWVMASLSVHAFLPLSYERGTYLVTYSVLRFARQIHKLESMSYMHPDPDTAVRFKGAQDHLFPSSMFQWQRLKVPNATIVDIISVASPRSVTPA